MVAFQRYDPGDGLEYAGITFIVATHGWPRRDRLKEVDTIINTKYYWAVGALPNKFDVESVMAHEFGHWLRLQHLYPGNANDPDEPEGCDEFTASVMYYKIPQNTIKRVHHWMEKWGKWYIYSSGKVKMAPSITPMEFPSAVQHTASPLQTRLLHNYPDPFNPETWIPYELADDANVSIDIYNVNGGLVRHLMIGQQPSGSYIDTSKAAYWNGKDNNGTDVASGVYFYTLTAVGTHRGSDFSQTKRLVILK